MILLSEFNKFFAFFIPSTTIRTKIEQFDKLKVFYWINKKELVIGKLNFSTGFD